jgi:hypothetical protein
LTTLVCLLHGGREMASVTSLAVLAIGVLLGLAAWAPFLWMIVRPSLVHKHKRLTYPKQQVQGQPTTKPDWLYGNGS